MTGLRFDYLLNAAAYSVLGVLLFGISFAVLNRILPFDLWKEVCENRNVALAILVGAMSLGIGVIIAATVH